MTIKGYATEGEYFGAGGEGVCAGAATVHHHPSCMPATVYLNTRRAAPPVLDAIRPVSSRLVYDPLLCCSFPLPSAISDLTPPRLDRHRVYRPGWTSSPLAERTACRLTCIPRERRTPSSSPHRLSPSSPLPHTLLYPKSKFVLFTVPYRTVPYLDARRTELGSCIV
ncbi:hypothetical protein B0H19DRAFT_1264701 [Mycena capillaripes]|nr:hypothetical protein B0H19DRAFT_1264701 [Mycena capillaripes]